MSRFMAWVATAVMLGVAGMPPVQASTATSPKASGIYPLVPGIFVVRGTDCGSPPNAAIKLYDGKGLGTAHTSACAAHVISTRKTKAGTSFDVSQTCNDEGDGSGKPFTEKQTIVVRDATHFSMPGTNGGKYDYCPVDALPDDLRSVLPSARAGT
ncbi:hypothetical protein L2Y94_09885 [Luteibacter aegosomatis]|uniref:hypothetical protein n=1 Tax=Luteibacter aegosomatis TaxID=2911537 RepID=UPI001FFB16E1|nr:hypothetical protein [Luteibacter aegosomatis]UPG87639.1 hypothetical protein L2Y94_09885 [Luteibacter aegosomatis]